MAKKKNVKVYHDDDSSDSFGWFIILIASVILFSTNPSEERHVSEVKLVLKKYLNKKVSSSGSDLFGFGSIVNGIGNMIIESELDQYIKRENYYLFSLTCIKADNKEQTIGWGVLGKVYISDKVEKQLDKLYNEAKESN